MFWNRMKKKDDEDRKALLEAIRKRGEAAEELIARIERTPPPDRREFDIPFEGPERRHA